MNLKVDKFGRILIPKSVRDNMGLEPGTEMDIIDEGDCIRLRPKPSRANLIWKKGVLVHTGKVAEGGQDIVEFIKKIRQQRDEQFFPNTKK